MNISKRKQTQYILKFAQKKVFPYGIIFRYLIHIKRDMALNA